MLIAQISDPHITEIGEKAYNIVPSNDNLALCIKHINQLEPQPDLALITGDIANDKKLEQTKNAASILDNLNCPYYIIPGNHDDKQALWSVFGGKAILSKDKNFINYVIDGYKMRIIGLDSTKENAAGGQMSQAGQQFLGKCLIEEPHKPTLIFMHHPPIKCSLIETDIDGFDRAEEFGELIAKFSNIKAIICGHIHLPTNSLWNGTIVSTAPSTGMQLRLDLSMKKPSEFYLNKTGYQLHHFTKQQNLITHTIYVHKNNDGPYPFIEHRPNQELK